ncbi:MAG TPA: patatin-like phospholipase family protein [Gemmatimonadaceae bacterium]|nr:patatin-like phospholipase family protein [Gemmatimonadaceae bacterium]
MAKQKTKIAVVLGGGGLKGFAHIGVLRAITERGIVPSRIAGTSIGAFIAAAYVNGMPIDEMQSRAESLQRRDLFRVDHVGMLVNRLRGTSIYLEAPLRALCESVAPPGTFEGLPIPLLVNTVDVERGTQVVWGLPGLQNVPVADAVYASCALPGAFPPGKVDGRVCVDGGVIDNMPAQIASVGMDAVIAADVGSSDLSPATDVTTKGFAAIYMRSATIMMHALQGWPLSTWSGPPMVLARPRLGHVDWLGFGNTKEVIAEGYRAASEALDSLDTALAAHGGIHPRRPVAIAVDRSKCTGCTTCVALAPRTMALDAEGKAYPLSPEREWSPADGDFVRHCPTAAITVKRLDLTDEEAAQMLDLPHAEPPEEEAA